jgi:steroid delta-isomerase-like uncharacterized protein
MENSQTNANVVKRFYDAFNQKNEMILDEVIAADYIDYGHQPPGRGVQGAKDDFRGLVGAFQDARFDIDDIIVTDDRVVARWSAQGTHTGDFLGLPATHRTMTLQGISIYKVRDGKILETHNAADLLSVLVQLGVFPPMAQEQQKAA